jgi:hypothetical protein
MSYERRRAVVVASLLIGDRLRQSRRTGNPAQPQPRGERLAHRAASGDPLRRPSLQGAHRLAVVAELGVIELEPLGELMSMGMAALVLWWIA